MFILLSGKQEDATTNVLPPANRPNKHNDVVVGHTRGNSGCLQPQSGCASLSGTTQGHQPHTCRMDKASSPILDRTHLRPHPQWGEGETRQQYFIIIISFLIPRPHTSTISGGSRSLPKLEGGICSVTLQNRLFLRHRFEPKPFVAQWQKVASTKTQIVVNSWEPLVLRPLFVWLREPIISSFITKLNSCQSNQRHLSILVFQTFLTWSLTFLSNLLHTKRTDLLVSDSNNRSGIKLVGHCVARSPILANKRVTQSASYKTPTSLCLHKLPMSRTVKEQISGQPTTTPRPSFGRKSRRICCPCKRSRSSSFPTPAFDPVDALQHFDRTPTSPSTEERPSPNPHKPNRQKASRSNSIIKGPAKPNKCSLLPRSRPDRL